MDFLEKIHPQWPLRVGLGAMFLWSGIDMFRHPRSWIWAMPDWFIGAVKDVMAVETYFKFQGASEVFLALLLLAWFLPRRLNLIIAAGASIEIFFILALGKTGIDAVTFRDLGVLGAGVALFLVLLREEQDRTPKSIEDAPASSVYSDTPPGVVSGVVE
jgi:hypothetical protein